MLYDFKVASGDFRDQRLYACYIMRQSKLILIYVTHALGKLGGTLLPLSLEYSRDGKINFDWNIIYFIAHSAYI